MSIRTVFWDIGGVLLANGFGHRQRAGFCDALGMTAVESAEFEVRREEANPEWERGLISLHDFFRRTLFEHPRNFTPADAWKAMCDQQKVLHPGCFDILRAMQARGQVRVATLNNESRELNDYRMDTFDLRQYFSMLFCSGYIGEMKPAPGIFRAALEMSNEDGAAACFIDDKVENVKAAVEAGFVGVHFTSPEKLRTDLQSLGLEL